MPAHTKTYKTVFFHEDHPMYIYVSYETGELSRKKPVPAS